MAEYHFTQTAKVEAQLQWINLMLDSVDPNKEF
jgi:hypothetical protein